MAVRPLPRLGANRGPAVLGVAIGLALSGSAAGGAAAALSAPDCGDACEPSHPAATAASKRKSCGTVHAKVVGVEVGGPVKARSVSCRRARAVVRYALTHSEGNAPLGPKGWQCARGGSPEVSRHAFVCTRVRGKGKAWLMNPVGAAAKRQPVPKVECLAGGRQVYRVAPRRCTLYEHGRPGTVTVTSMTWRGWGRKRARGRGTIHYFDHPEFSGRVVVVLRRIRGGHCAPGRYYTAARLRTISGQAKGNVVRLNLAAGCPA